MISFVTRFLPPTTKAFLRHRLGATDMEWSLGNLRQNGFIPSAIVDVGAYKGEWTTMVRRVFPEASVLMIEAQEEKASILSQLALESNDAVAFCRAFLGPKERSGETFYVNETVSSALAEHFPTHARSVTMDMRTLDDVLTTAAFPTPQFIKLDVQGFELEILRGAARTLQSSTLEVLLLEISLIDINVGAPSMLEVLSFLDPFGFRLYDLCSMLRRPLDGALWQTDALFVREGSPLINSKRWG